MKNFLGKSHQLLMSITIIIGLVACNTSKREDPKDVAGERNEAKFDNKEEKDAKFLVNAAEINLEEIQLAQLAQRNGLTIDVKELGKMMEEAHTKSLSELKLLAQKKVITIPTTTTENAQNAFNKLDKNSGSDFDKSYCNMMVDGHKEAISLFEDASTNALDIDIKNWATSTLPMLRSHLDNAVTCQKKYEKM